MKNDLLALAPCPFCGESNAERETNHNNWPVIMCNDCGACGPCIDIDAEKAVERWNTRATSTRAPALDREAVEKALIETVPGIGKSANTSVRNRAVDAILALLPAAPVEPEPVGKTWELSDWATAQIQGIEDNRRHAALASSKIIAGQDTPEPVGEVEPVAWQWRSIHGGPWYECSEQSFQQYQKHCGIETRPLYAAPIPSPAADLDRLRDALDGIRQYGADTLSGCADGGSDDRQWQREAVREMTRRARTALAAEARADALEKVLKPFAAIYDRLPKGYPDILMVHLEIKGSSACEGEYLTVKDFRAARAALAKMETWK